jgi:hypothetical protein
MNILMMKNASQQQISSVISKIESCDIPVHLSRKNGQTSITVISDGHPYLTDEFNKMRGVEKISLILP